MSQSELFIPDINRQSTAAAGEEITSIPRVTSEVFAIPLEEDRYLIYAPLRRSAFVANARVVNFIAGLKDGVFNMDDDPDRSIVAFLLQLKILDATPELPPVTTFRNIPEPTSISLFLTTMCNLRCTYCYASAGDTPLRAMSLEVAKRGIDFVSANALKRGMPTFQITYHGGGEPTTNWRVMTESLAYARERAAQLGLKPPPASAASNGVLSEDQISWMITHLNGGTSISYDGLPSVNDLHRLNVLGQGTSDRVIHTLRRFDQAGYPYGIRVTVTADNLANLPDSIEFICTSFGTNRIQVEPSFKLGRWREAPSAETTDFITAFRLAQARAARHGREIFFSGARLGSLSNHFCGVTQDSFAISPDGNVSACFEVFSEDDPLAHVFFYGRPGDKESPYFFDLAVLNRLRSQGVENRGFCEGCFAKWTCSGDCYHKSVSATGQLEFEGTDRCHITRELTKDQILANIALAGGMFWHGAPQRGPNRPEGKEILV